MADGDQRVTRSKTSSTTSSWLSLGDYIPYGREARIARSPHNSPNPTPSPRPAQERAFFPSPETNSLPPIANINGNTMTEAAATLDTLSTALSGLQISSRKPDLPPFDKNSIEKWIRRVESAYIRSGITVAREKFAFIESKFPVDEDPAVDEFLFGPPTDENWTAFTTYLTQRYGKTKRQKVAAILEPMKMDGRTPSQYIAKLKQSYGDITLDDIVKEICVRQLPVDLQQTMCKDTETMSASDMMKYADKFYNPDGSRIHKKPPSINVVKANTNPTTTSFTTPFNSNDEQDDEQTDVNAVRGRGGAPQQRQNGGGFGNARSKSRGRFGGNNNNNNNGGGGGFQNRNGGGGFNGYKQNNNRQNNNNDPSLCFYHNMYGDKAKKCDFGCARSKNQGNGSSPRQ